MKERLDILVSRLPEFPSREKARIAIMEGLILVKGQVEDKPGTLIDIYAPIEVKNNPLKYVSRGGLKLEKAMELWPICLHEKIAADIGASTGGFTDCMLQNNAKKVYSVDVGYGQLAWKLRTNPKVVNLEKTNARYLTENEIKEPLDFASFDVSFISVTKVLPPVYSLLKEGGEAVSLIKPQFEAGREKVGKKGVVREPETHMEVCQSVLEKAEEIGFSVLGLTYSPIKGPEGNIEYLVYLKKENEKRNLVSDSRIAEIVRESHENLAKKGEEN